MFDCFLYVDCVETIYYPFNNGWNLQGHSLFVFCLTGHSSGGQWRFSFSHWRWLLKRQSTLSTSENTEDENIGKQDTNDEHRKKTKKQTRFLSEPVICCTELQLLTLALKQIIRVNVRCCDALSLTLLGVTLWWTLLWHCCWPALC